MPASWQAGSRGATRTHVITSSIHPLSSPGAVPSLPRRHSFDRSSTVQLRVWPGFTAWTCLYEAVLLVICTTMEPPCHNPNSYSGSSLLQLQNDRTLWCLRPRAVYGEERETAQNLIPMQATEGEYLQGKRRTRSMRTAYLYG